MTHIEKMRLQAALQALSGAFTRHPDACLLESARVLLVGNRVKAGKGVVGEKSSVHVMYKQVYMYKQVCENTFCCIKKR